MRIRIEGQDLPGDRCHPSPDAPMGYTGIRVGVQRRGNPDDVLDPVTGSSPSVTWVVDCTVQDTPDGVDIRGPYIQGRPHQRFIYLSWLSDQGSGPLGMFRRAKIRLDEIPLPVLDHAKAGGDIAITVRLTDAKGNPACATLGPPGSAWQAV